MTVYIPDIDELVPLPKNAVEALPPLTPQQELDMRVRTIKLLADLTGADLNPTPEGEADAEELARKMMLDPKVRPDYSQYPNETLAYLAGMVAQSKSQIVDDLSELKMYVVNKLIYEVENAATSKDRISAIKSLGEVDGIDAFKKRSEITHTIKPIEEVEKELFSVLKAVKGTITDAEFEVLPAPDQKTCPNP